jgi:hypothetical protein
MNTVKLRSPYEIPLYVLSVLVNLIIIALILVGALLLGYLNALAGEPLSGPTVDAIRVAFLARCCSSCLAWSCIVRSPARAHEDRR